ncbi:SubName: Full=Uncharacterized protein {ECO:0000313/EMBL:CCA73930.1} [Serendipita indica DSM 11827]|nr:SubName: Full=Uncharacterized protein {ECO:0000313/EMBL:CCA73930.1} [Serendipita indica DSM 11827]
MGLGARPWCVISADTFLPLSSQVKDDSDNDSGYCSVTQTTKREESLVIPVIKVTPLTSDEMRVQNSCVRTLHDLRIANLIPYNSSSSLDPSPYSAAPTANDTQSVTKERQRERNFPQKTLYIPQESHTKRLKDTWENRCIWPFLFEAPYTTTPYLVPSSSQGVYASKRANLSSTSLDRYGRRKSLGLPLGVEVHPAMMMGGTMRPRGWSVDGKKTVNGTSLSMAKRRMSVDSFASSTSTVDRASWSGSSRASSPTSASSSSDELPSKNQHRLSLGDVSKIQNRTLGDASNLQNRTLGDASKLKNRTLSVDANGIPTWRSTSPYIYASSTSSRRDSNSSLSSMSTTDHHSLSSTRYTTSARVGDENTRQPVGGGRRLVRGGAVKRPYSMVSTPTTGSLPVLPTSSSFGSRTSSTTSLASVTTSTHDAPLTRKNVATGNAKQSNNSPSSTTMTTSGSSAGVGKRFKSISTDQLVASNTSTSDGENKPPVRRSGFGRLRNFVGGLYSTAPSSFRL